MICDKKDNNTDGNESVGLILEWMKQFAMDYARLDGCGKFGLRWINLLFRHNIRFLLWYRLWQRGSLIGRIGCFRCSRRYGLEFSRNATIAPGLFLGHPYNITVGNGVVIGKNVNLSKGCTLGNIRTGKRQGSPRIGDCVFIGINATIVGGISVGDDVVIAPNAFVNFDVPPHSVVIGNPGIIHHKDNATGEIILNRV